VYEPNWREARQKNLENIRREREDARVLAESEKEVYVPVNYVYKSTAEEKKAYYESVLNYHREVLEKETPESREYKLSAARIAELQEELGY
jgi:hypothetical protein